MSKRTSASSFGNSALSSFSSFWNSVKLTALVAVRTGIKVPMADHPACLGVVIAGAGNVVLDMAGGQAALREVIAWSQGTLNNLDGIRLHIDIVLWHGLEVDRPDDALTDMMSQATRDTVAGRPVVSGEVRRMCEKAGEHRPLERERMRMLRRHWFAMPDELNSDQDDMQTRCGSDTDDSDLLRSVAIPSAID